MSNETDLDWLARNVHEWNSELGFVFMVKMKNGDNSYMHTRDGYKYHPYCMGNAVLNAKPYSKAQWLARRAELQGEIEKTRAEAEVDLVNAVAEAFKPFTSIEDNQELNMSQQQEVKQDNGWFERGELPPVGTVCEYTLGANAPWYQCEIKYVIRGDGVVMKRIPCGDEQYCELLHRHPVSFRPIRTERELAIEEMCRDVDLHVSVFELEAGKLYDAGYRKDPK